MPFPDHGSLITGFLEFLGHGPLGGVKSIPIGPKTIDVAVFSRENGRPARTANRIRGQGDSFPIHQHYDREEIYGQGIGIAETIADVNSAIPYELGIIDGMTTIHYGKLMNLAERRDAQGQLPVYPSNLLLASFDRVAIDATASRVMKLNPYKIYHLYLSSERGCGTIDQEKIDVQGERIDDIEMTCFPMLKQRATML